jgi:hypothetical protein
VNKSERTDFSRNSKHPQDIPTLEKSDKIEIISKFLLGENIKLGPAQTGSRVDYNFLQTEKGRHIIAYT